MLIKYTKYIILLLGALLLGSCEKSSDSIFTQLGIRIIMSNSSPFEELNVIAEKSYFYNVNTYERVEFPQLDKNRATIKLRKGVYTLIIEAEVKYSNGDVKLLRNADYNQTSQALTWVKDSESIVLLLKSVN